MYAIVEIQGQQFKAEQGKKLFVHHIKDDKVIVFKMKRRKDSRSRNGHREQFTEVEIKSVIA